MCQDIKASGNKSIWDEQLTQQPFLRRNSLLEDIKGSEKFDRRETHLASLNPTFPNIIGH